MKLAKQINAYLERTGKTAQQFSKEVEIPSSVISNYRHNQNPSPENERKILMALGLKEIPKPEVKKVSPEEAAQRLGVPLKQVQQGLIQKIWPFKDFGYAIKYPNSTKFHYVIFERKFNEFIEEVKS